MTYMGAGFSIILWITAHSSNSGVKGKKERIYTKAGCLLPIMCFVQAYGSSFSYHVFCEGVVLCHFAVQSDR